MLRKGKKGVGTERLAFNVLPCNWVTFSLFDSNIRMATIRTVVKAEKGRRGSLEQLAERGITQELLQKMYEELGKNCLYQLILINLNIFFLKKMSLQINQRNGCYAIYKMKKEKKVILKLQQGDTVITDNMAMQNIFHQYYPNSYKTIEISWRK